ncbi:Mce protein [Mycobacterium intermedium]|uniref:Mce protein n=1 Tax=Mycobacterium intermedium TaxID=28445 RepID=A0A1E3SK82_MYCIE|nr:Mce protein [Mycobacterium intermedium]MCV6962814.1 Mce protein [Mycobacterium intermedium]ODR02545.1 Mce protein [Mycobacterium intermedium]OPE50632.1 Mce protein [Mycobacterium intermedium]ORB09912.1 Mce protein [Mycobacterium intermedium]
MEGDAGTGRLNPIADDSLRDQVNAEDSTESEAQTEQISTEAEATTASDSTESEGDAVAADESEAATEESESPDPETPATDLASDDGVQRPPSRLGRGWVVTVCIVLFLLAGGISAGGYLALRYHLDSQAIARNNEAALQAAKDCVAVTQAPDTDAMAASEQKIIDCGTDAYRTQAVMYSSMLVQAYQSANVHVQVSDLRAAVEHNNPDGTIDVLVAMRVRVSNNQQENQETGYRLRVRMAMAEGQYRISKLDQVTK